QIVDALWDDDPVRNLVEPARERWREHEFHVALDVRFDGPALHADRVAEIAAREHVLFRQLVLAPDAPRLPDTELRRDLDDVGVLKAGRVLLDELEDVPALSPPFDFAVAELSRVDAADGAA